MDEPRRLLPKLVLMVLCLWALASRVSAQQDLWVPELPMTRDVGTHARALGLGGAYLALSDDAAALRYNPAGLARVTRIEFSGGLIDRHVEHTNKDAGREARADMTRTRVSSLGFVYPFPTYRGSMVIGLGYSLPYIMDREYVRSGPRATRDVDETVFDEGSVGEWSFGYAVDVSPILSLGFRATWISGSFFQDWTFENEYFDVHSVVETDVTGYTGSLGAMARLGQWGRLGMTLDLPRWINMETEQTDAEGEPLFAEEEMTLPFSFGGGLAAFWRRLMVTADVRFTDWTQIDYEGPMRYLAQDGRRELAYRRTVELHVGAEYLLDIQPGAGLRLRGGFAYEPVPYDVVFTDISAAAEPVYAAADYDPQRTYFTAGLGVLLEQSLTADIAFATGSFTREGGGVSEQVDERRILLTAGFRLQ